MPVSRRKRFVIAAAVAALGFSLFTAVPSFACYWQNTGGDNWTLVMEPSDNGSCSIGAPPSSGSSSTPAPAPSSSSTPDPMPTADTPTPDPTPTPTPDPTPTPSPTADTKPDPTIVKDNEWLNVETPTQKAEETQTVRSVTIRTDGAAVAGIVLTADDDSASQVCPSATSCTFALPDKAQFTWIVFNPTYFKVGAIAPRASALNTYSAVGGGTASGDVTLTVAVATGAEARRPVDLSAWKGISGWVADASSAATVKIDSLISDVNLQGMFGPHADALQVKGLPAGLSFNASTGAITGKPTAAGTSTATFIADDLNVPVQFSVAQLTYKLKILSDVADLWLSVHRLDGGQLCSALPCSVNVPIGAEVRIRADSEVVPLRVETATVSAGLTPKLSNNSLDVSMNDWLVQSDVMVSSTSSSAGAADGEVVFRIVSNGPTGSPYTVTASTAGQPALVDSYIAFAPRVKTPIAGTTVVKLVPHPNVGGQLKLDSCNKGVSIGSDGLTISAVLSRDSRIYTNCTLLVGGRLGFIELGLSTSAEPLKTLPTPTVQRTEGPGKQTFLFPAVDTLFAGWDLSTLSSRVTSYHVSLLTSNDGYSYGEVMYFDPAITAKGIEFSQMPAGKYELRISLNDKLGSPPPAQQIRYWQPVGTGVSLPVDTSGIKAFLNSKLRVL